MLEGSEAYLKDKILLKNIILYAYLGVKEEEREVRQKISLDVKLSLDLEEAARSDSLVKTVDYEKVYNLIKERIEDKKYHLLEALAQDIAQEILKDFPIEEVLIRTKKHLATTRAKSYRHMVSVIKCFRFDSRDNLGKLTPIGRANTRVF